MIAEGSSISVVLRILNILLGQFPLGFKEKENVYWKNMKKKQKLLQKSLKEEVEEIIYNYKVYWENINEKKLKTVSLKR